MDSSRQALQTYESFFQIWESIFELTTLFKNNSDVGFVHARNGGNYADQHAFLVFCIFSKTSCSFYNLIKKNYSQDITFSHRCQ